MGEMKLSRTDDIRSAARKAVADALRNQRQNPDEVPSGYALSMLARLAEENPEADFAEWFRSRTKNQTQLFRREWSSKPARLYSGI